MSGMSSTLLLVIGIAGIFAGLGVALTVIGVATSEKKAVGRSLAALEAMRGLPAEMTDELDRPFNERVVEPMLQRFTKLGRRFTASDSAERIQHRLDIAGNPVGWTVDRIAGLKVAGFGIALLLSIIVTMLLGAQCPVDADHLRRARDARLRVAEPVHLPDGFEPVGADAA